MAAARQGATVPCNSSISLGFSSADRGMEKAWVRARSKYAMLKNYLVGKALQTKQSGFTAHTQGAIILTLDDTSENARSRAKTYGNLQRKRKPREQWQGNLKVRESYSSTQRPI